MKIVDENDKTISQQEFLSKYGNINVVAHSPRYSKTGQSNSLEFSSCVDNDPWRHVDISVIANDYPRFTSYGAANIYEQFYIPDDCKRTGKYNAPYLKIEQLLNTLKSQKVCVRLSIYEWNWVERWFFVGPARAPDVFLTFDNKSES